MIEINLMYEIYINHLNVKLTSYLNKSIEADKHKNSFKNLLESYKNTINTYLNISYNDLLKEININNIIYPTYKIYNNGKELNFNIVKLYIEKYIYYNNKYNNYYNKYNTIKNKIISLKIYKEIILKFNSKIINKIIYKNYHFNFYSFFGAISIIQNKNERKRVNWGISNKNKKELLKKGEIPYIKEDAEKQGEKYKGKKWLVYHPSIDFFLHWHTKWIAKKLNPYLKDYKYIPARGKNSIVSKLQDIKENRERALSIYTRKCNE